MFYSSRIWLIEKLEQSVRYTDCMIYLFHGDNTYAAKQQINRLIEHYKKSAGSDLGLHNFSEDSEPEDVIHAITAVSMFSNNSLVIVENPSRSKQLTDRLLAEIDNVPEQNLVVIHDPQIDKRTSWFKTLQKQAKVKEFKTKSEDQLLRWMDEKAKGHGSELTKEGKKLLFEYVGSDEWRLYNEIAKLSNAAAKIDQELVKQLVQPAPRQTIFALLDVLSEGNTSQALNYLDDLRAQKIHELEILAMLGWHLRTLLVVSSTQPLPDEQVTREHGINPFVMRKSKPLARRVPAESLSCAYQEIINTDYAMKTSQHEPRVLLEQLVLRISEYLKKQYKE